MILRKAGKLPSGKPHREIPEPSSVQSQLTHTAARCKRDTASHNSLCCWAFSSPTPQPGLSRALLPTAPLTLGTESHPYCVVFSGAVDGTSEAHALLAL